MSKAKRVCVIGAGPCGMSILYHFNKAQGKEIPEIVCFDKQSDWGGLWKYSWETEIIPSDWIDAIIAILFKKGDRSQCSNYRSISLLSAVGKVFADVILQRLCLLADLIYPQLQSGYRHGRSTIDGIFTLRQLMEKTFVDFVIAFDTVNRELLFIILGKLGCPPKFIRIIKKLYTDVRARLAVDGTDGYGEPVHGSMYRGLWSNTPKEVLEFPDYTFEEHFGKAIPSFPPRPVLYDYLKGRWTKNNLRPYIRFNHVVRQVTYNDETDDFTVLVKNLPEDRVLPAQRFDYVIVANGHFSVPNVPYFSGIDEFPGRVIHAHDLKNACQYKNKTVLVVGSSHSAEDIALQTIKYGAKKVVCTWRTKPMGFKWPPQITEKPLLTKIEGNTVHFKDATTEVVDDVILCTGYHFSFPFMEERLRLKTRNALYAQGLYKSILWMHGGNNKVHYLGMVDQLYSFTMFDAQAHWVKNCIMGEITLPNKQAMEQEAQTWIAKMDECKVLEKCIDFQTAYIADIVKDSKYGYDLDAAQIFYSHLKDRENDITTYRDKCFTSKFTGKTSPALRIPFMQAMGDSLEAIVGQ